MKELISEEALEALRIKAKKRNKLGNIITAILGIPCVVFSFVVAMQDTSDGFFSTLFGAIVLSVCILLGIWYLTWVLFSKKLNKKFAKEFKSKYVLNVINSNSDFSNITYSRKGGYTWDDVRNAAVCSCGDKEYFGSEDFLKGSYKGIPFEVSDVVTQVRVPRGKSSSIETIFSGQIYCFEGFDKEKISNLRIQVFKKEFLSDFRGWTAKNIVQTESAVFSKNYQCYADDEHNAYYILTPQRIEKIQNFAETVKDQFSLCFYQNKLYVAVYRKSNFEPLLNVPVHEQTKNILEDLKVLEMAYEILIDGE